MNAAHLEAYLTELEHTLAELQVLQEAKQRALASLDVAALERIACEEGALAPRLEAAARRRNELLDSKETEAPKRRSLRDWIPKDATDPRHVALRQRWERVRSQSRRVRQATSANWLAAFRTHQHLQQLLEVMATAGRSPGADVQGGGLVLDCTA